MESGFERRYQSLLRLVPKMQGTVRLGALLDLIASEVRSILGAERCSIFLIDEERRQLWTPVAQGVNGQGLRISLDQGIAGRVVTTGAPIRVRNAYRDPDFDPEVDSATGFRTRSVLAAPLRDAAGRVFGAFEALNKVDGEFTDEDEALLVLLASLAASAVDNAKLYEGLHESYLETAQRLALVAEFRDTRDTGPHLRHISRYSKILALAAGLPEARAEMIECASPLHDIGKVAIADSILRKTGRLSREEFERMKTHAVLGWEMLAQSKSPLLRLAAEIALAHHERYDGSGYPKGLAGDAIPFEAQVVAVADVFDALTTERVYKRAWSFEEASDHIREQSGKLYHPRVAAAFARESERMREAWLEQRLRTAAGG